MTKRKGGELVDLFTLCASIALDKTEYERGLDDASKKTHSFGEKLKSGLATAAKAGAAGLAAASSALGVLTKSAVEAYGDYEQLTGGVETLFGASADAVVKNAERAYKTAGLSANEYMETVTSFSAALLQSLEGDTYEAMESADKAITDMADNANKMGTAMDSIQNAYQGFAKQNFTMLDNLKLGYGGTKEEMQRLLDKANEINAEQGIITDYQINSYADIVDAIHVVQTEMGITGTTALEASTTIQGSVSSAKSAWENLVAGLGSENADLDQLVSDLVTSVETAAGNILPRVTQILSGMGTAITQIAPVISAEVPNLITSILPSMVSGGAQLLTGLISGLISALPGLISAVPEIVTSVATAVSDNLPTIQAAGLELLNMMTTGILEGIPEMLGMLPDVFTNLYNFLAENLPGVIEKGFDILMSLVDGIIEAIPGMVAKLPEVIQAMMNYLTSVFPVILKKGGELLGQLIMGILGAIPEIAVQLPNVISAIVDALESGWGLIKDAGKYLLEGLWAGISDKVEWLKGKVTGVVDTIKGWFTGKDGFDEHSPSKWANQVFRYVMEGGGNGLEEGLPGLMGDVSNVVNKVKGGMNFGTANVDFASSAVGQSSAAIVNSISGGETGAPVIPLTINLLTGDSRAFAQWILADLIAVANADGTPIAGQQYA